MLLVPLLLLASALHSAEASEGMFGTKHVAKKGAWQMDGEIKQWEQEARSQSVDTPVDEVRKPTIMVNRLVYKQSHALKGKRDRKTVI